MDIGKKRHSMDAGYRLYPQYGVVALLVCALVVVLSAGPALAGEGQKIKVMTQNLYVGADLDRISNAASLTEIPFITAEVYQFVMMSNFEERAEVIADQIARYGPDLIGLQEVTLLRTQSPSDFDLLSWPPSNPTLATEVELDFLDILMEKLDDRGLDYRVVSAVEDFDIELPMFTRLDQGIPLFDDVRLTDRDVILARGDVGTSNATGTRYWDFYPVLIYPVYRGFAAVDATIGDRTFHFVSTHLEVRGPESVFGGQAQFKQAQELISVLGEEELPIILVGDFNSAPVEGSDDTYNLITGTGAGEGGFVDTWTRGLNGRQGKGVTCCQDEFLDNSPSKLYERVDHVFLRNHLREMPFDLTGSVVVDIIGDKEKDKTISGLWPSDHAGVAAKMVVPGLWVIPMMPQ